MLRPAAPGCAVIVLADGKPAGECADEPVVVAWLHFRWPPPDGTTVPGFLRGRHRDHEQVVRSRPLNDADRAELARRRAEQAHWDQVLADSRRDAGWVR